MRRSVCEKVLLLALAAFLIFVPDTAQAAPGSLLHSSSLNISQEAKLSAGVYWSNSQNDRVTEHYIEYTPNETVKPIIGYGNYIYGGNSLANLESLLADGGQKVIAAINGDYFNMSTVVPLSSVIEGGILKGSEGSSWDSIGFYEDGRAIIGRLGLSMQLKAHGENYVIAKLNKELTAGAQSIQMFSADYATTTRTTMPVNYGVLRISEGYVGINRTVTAYVEQNGSATTPLDIPINCLVLAIPQDSPNEAAKAALLNLTVGQQVTINISGNAAWENILYGVGGGEKLLTNGQVVAPKLSVGMTTPLAPRTALGVRADGSFIMYSVDGRQPGYSTGASLAEVAQRLLELGCVEAVNLDGGGSTTLSAVYPGQTGLATVNNPSGGTLRTCANYIMLVNQGYAGGSARQLHLYPFDSIVLAGSSLDLSLAATNESYLPASLPRQEAHYSLSSNSLGYVDENGRFTAGNIPFEGYVFAEAGDVSGAARITVVNRADSVNLLYGSGQAVGKEITLYGGGSVQLAVKAVHNHMNIVADAASFQWSISGDIGTVDQYGLLTANKNLNEGQGILTASLGNLNVSVPVTVSSKGYLLNDFESVMPREGIAWQLMANTDKAYVRYGHSSARMDYDFSTAYDSRINMPLDIALADNPGYVNFWVYGDESQNQLLFTLQQEGQMVELPAVTLDFAGWQYVTVSLPPNTTALLSLELMNYGSQAGSIYLDQLLSSHGQYIDNDPPQISLTVEGNAVSATISDGRDKELNPMGMILTYDGRELQFTYEAAGGKLTATLPESNGLAHRLTLSSRDKSGNIGRCSYDIAATEPSNPFVDTVGHWAESYTSYLYQQGIVSGIQDNRGLLYAPDTNMNRAQFAVIMCNWLRLDTAAYAQVELPFADKGTIGEWAYPAVQAMYALGVTRGSALDGALYFNPASPISRAEAMTMIGRTQERGYTEAELNFADNASIPAWSLPYVRALVGQEVVSGTGDNKLAPSAYVTRGQIAKMLYSLM